MIEIERLWGIAHHTSFLIVLCLTGYCLYRFLRPFCPGAKKTWLSGGAYTLTMAVLYCVPWELPAVLAYLAGTAAAFAALLFVDRSNLPQKAFLFATFFALRWLSLTMEATIYLTLHHLLLDPPAIAARPLLQFWLFLGLKAVDIALSFLFIALSCQMVAKVYRHKHLPMGGRELLLLLVPALSGIIPQLILQHFILNAGTLSERWLCFPQEAIALAAILVTIVLYERVKGMQMEQAEQEVLAEQISSMRRHIGEVERLYAEMRGLKHDMANHIHTLLALSTHGEAAAAADYAKTLQGQLDTALPAPRTGHPVTDVLLAEAAREAEARGVPFDCAFQYPTGSMIDAFDMAVILHNALSNAFTAAEGIGGVSLRSRRRKRAFLIEIENACAAAPAPDAATGLPPTTKPDAAHHGLGLPNIRRTAARYQGCLEIDCGEGVFRLSILLQLT